MQSARVRKKPALCRCTAVLHIPDEKVAGTQHGRPVDGKPNACSSETLGRVYTISPSAGEQFYLHVLLHAVRGPPSFKDYRRNHMCHV